MTPHDSGEGEGESRDARELFARFLAQREELALPHAVLPGLPRADALKLARRAPAAEAPGSVDPPTPAPAESDPASAAVGRQPAASSPSAPREAQGSAAGVEGPPTTELPPDHPGLKEVATGCNACRLAEGRTQVVFHDGNPAGRLMVVGEAPGANEDRTGLPFVGQAGKLLDLLLASVGLSRRHSAYICNVIKCRPPGNRDPRPDEIEACAPYLRRQIELVGPEALLAVGTFAGKLLSGQDLPLGQLRGEVYSHQGVPLVVTYHPAALLRNAGWTRSTWEDLQLLRQVLDGPRAA